MAKAEGTFALLQYAFNTLLFMFRIRAVFFDHKFIVGFFWLSWVTVVGTGIPAPVTIEASPIGNTDYCADGRLNRTVIGIVAVAVNDTLVFLFITAKLLLLHQDGPVPTSWWKMLLTGEGMGKIARIMLQTGQLYYLVTAGFTITSSVLILIPSVSTPYSDVTVPVSAFVTNVMAARVYRQLKLGLLYDHTPGNSHNINLDATLEFRVKTVTPHDSGGPTASAIQRMSLKLDRGVDKERTVHSDHGFNIGSALSSPVNAGSVGSRGVVTFEDDRDPSRSSESCDGTHYRDEVGSSIV